LLFGTGFIMHLLTLTTNAGTPFAMLPLQANAPAPTLLLLAWSGVETLTSEPYCLTGRLLHAHGWNVVSLDLPCHGTARYADEPEGLTGWAARIAVGDNIVADFHARVHDVLEHLIATGHAKPRHIAAAGTSRGGFMALHAAVGNPHIRAVAAFAPVTDLLALHEFAGQEENPLLPELNLMQAVETLAARATWLIIGNADERVDTARVVAFAHSLSITSQQRNPAGEVTLCVLPVPGHCSLAEWHNEAAEWLLTKLGQ